MQESLDMPIKLLLLLVGSAALAAVKAQGEFEGRLGIGHHAQATYTRVLDACVSCNVNIRT